MNNIRNAEEILAKTYWIFREPGLLLAALEQISRAQQKSLEKLRKYKFNKPDMTIQSYMNKTGHIHVIKKVSCILNAHKEAPVEIRKEDKYIIFDDKYSAKELTPYILGSILAD